MQTASVKRLIDKLVEQYDKDIHRIDGNEIFYNATLNDYGRV